MKRSSATGFLLKMKMHQLSSRAVAVSIITFSKRATFALRLVPILIELFGRPVLLIGFFETCQRKGHRKSNQERDVLLTT